MHPSAGGAAHLSSSLLPPLVARGFIVVQCVCWWLGAHRATRSPAEPWIRAPCCSTAAPPAYTAAWYFWQDGIAVGSGDFSQGWSAVAGFSSWVNTQPDFYQNNEVCAAAGDEDAMSCQHVAAQPTAWPLLQAALL